MDTSQKMILRRRFPGQIIRVEHGDNVRIVACGSVGNEVIARPGDMLLFDPMQLQKVWFQQDGGHPGAFACIPDEDCDQPFPDVGVLFWDAPLSCRCGTKPACIRVVFPGRGLLWVSRAALETLLGARRS